MAVKFNPFTGQLQIDEKGSGGGSSYIDGEVATYNDLPLDGTAALNSAWLVREASGIWPVSRKQAGIYIRTATGGVSRDADFTYAGTMPDVFSDAVLTIYDDASTTRTGQFNLGSITAGQNRVLTWPDGNGTIARTEDFAAPPAIGSTTPSTGAFTTLSASGTVSGTGFSNYLASPPAIGGTSAAAGSFTTLSASTSLTLGTSGILSGGTNTIEQRNTTSAQTFRIYNTVSGAADANYERGFLRWSSNVLQIGTEKAGTGSARALELHTDGTNRFDIATNGNISLQGRTAIRNSQVFEILGGSILFATVTAGDGAGLFRDSLGVLALRNSTQPHTLRIYNTVSGTNNVNFERANFRWASNEFIIDAEAGGTGTSLRGIKIGSATSSLLGFWNATPAAQPAAVADATDAASTQARLNDLLARLRTIGIIAT